jgi:hypothetical protein
MHPAWARSVVWAFGHHPEVEALYGARIVEDPAATGGEPSGMLPLLEFLPYDRARHERANFVDRNTVAFRSRHADLRFDETLDSAWDWDHSLRLFGRAAPLSLPAIACYYGTWVPDRVSETPTRLEMLRRIRARAHVSRPLRVHLHRVDEDMAELEAAGAVVSASSGELEAVLAADPPDLVVLGPAATAAALEALERHGTPFWGRDLDGELSAHPLCLRRPEGRDGATLEPALRQRLTEWLFARA